MRNRALLLGGLIIVLALVLMGCSLGPMGAARVTATPTKTVRPIFTSTLTPTASPLPTDTPYPTATAIPATDTPLPTDTPVPTQTPVPTETPVLATEAPLPTATVAPTDVPPTATPPPPPPTQPAATNTPAPPTNTPKPQVDFRIKEIVAFEDGSLTRSGFHNIYLTVIDASGAPIDGIVLEEFNNQPSTQVVTGDKGQGKTEFTMYADDYRFKVVGNSGGQSFRSEETHVLSIVFGHQVWDDLIRGGICTDEAACRGLGPMHFSYNVTFQRTW